MQVFRSDHREHADVDGRPTTGQGAATVVDAEVGRAGDAGVIDLATDPDAEIDRDPEAGDTEAGDTEAIGPDEPVPVTAEEPVVPEAVVAPRRGLVRVRGLRIRRIRPWSVTKIATVFFALGYAAVLASAVLVWNLAHQLGMIADIEELVVTSLGLERFEVSGAALFEVFAIATGVLAVFGLVVTVLLAFVYNAAGALFGGVALETGPLRRPRRVFSLRHRRFVSV